MLQEELMENITEIDMVWWKGEIKNDFYYFFIEKHVKLRRI